MMKERFKGRKNYPTEEVDPDNYLSDSKVRELIKNKEKLRFKQNDYFKLFNCVHCGECDTEEERLLLKQKYLEEGNTVDGLDEMIECFNKYRTPYPSNKMRIKRPEGIPTKSDTLFYMGCLSTIRIPRYTEHALEYLLKHKVDFTILDKEICCGWPWFASGCIEEFETAKKENIEIFKEFKKVICLCPACYFLFNKYLKPEMDSKTEFKYVSDYLKPSETKKSGKVGIQHLCQLMNRGKTGVDKLVNNVLERSGYDVVDIPHWCCGGGLGYMHRKDVIDKVATKRMSDFDAAGGDFSTTYCPSCWWILARYSKLCKISPKAKDLFELLL